ncbi:murein biosynthesis integral membrane protein MurJ [Candidatus Shapirobacteria bacterium CG10_big_fil_rev_8_21_14_0_10_48_15]|uniref:Probable lipid II flippase MurJ n=1 Tax=Candidatus Shapirobacteria bacterium CG10_big_fil_rev_8_21_14_0_10_48_15 TaxID=1974484 RepID=A0A2M8L7B4_9BACT|nr:MAG: murein biosynthesis integral membrane protein MurJ [Candidatus Shapirobacteria bacterium CG10_big_fil_rev_8_21_14_0_10_48_15]
MMKNFWQSGSRILTRKQTSILSAATIIMLMVAASRVLGLMRNRVLAHFFSVETLAVYFAAFRLPEVIFEVLVFGALSSAFIPTFTRLLSKKQTDEAWYVAAISLNFAFLFFFGLSLLVFIFAAQIYQLIAPGFDAPQIELVVKLTRVLVFTQAFFVLSYFLTGVLESLQRFLVPAIAPLFYNLGIILGAVFLAGKIGIYAPVVGAVIGAFFHFAVQLPVAYHFGFRPKFKLDLKHPGVREIGRLALPRMVELSFLQIGKSAELFLASLVSAAAYTYYTFAGSLQLLPVSLFGVSIAKASLPTLSTHSAKQDLELFKQTFVASFNEVAFLVVPFSVFLAVLRVPVVRLTLGASRFSWESTVQTGLTLSAFCLSIFAQALIYLLNRAFYALHDTKTPVKIAIGAIFAHISLGATLILGFGLPVWSLALAFSLASMAQFGLLLFKLTRRLPDFAFRQISLPFLKVALASGGSGVVMFFLLKLFDRSVWAKQLSWLGHFNLSLPMLMERFVLDTRYIGNLLLLTALVALVGLGVFLLLGHWLKIKEMAAFGKLLLRFRQPKKIMAELPENQETVILPED